MDWLKYDSAIYRPGNYSRIYELESRCSSIWSISESLYTRESYGMLDDRSSTATN